MADVLKYALDPSGTLVDNRVLNEVHTLELGKSLRAVAPLEGAFFVSSMKIKNVATEKYLTPHLDYYFLELYETLTLKYGKEIAGLVIIRDSTIGGDISLEYQVVGFEYNRNNKATEDIINAKQETILARPEWAEIHEPLFFLPSPLIHELGTNFGFEYLSYALERLRSAILNSENSSYDYILNKIKEFINGITPLLDRYFDDVLSATIRDYRNQLNKKLANLEKVINLPLASDEEARIYATKAWKYKQASDNKYLITSTLAAFKEILYNSFISTEATGIDRHKGVLAVPQFVSLLNMTNGTRYVIDSLEKVQLNKVPYDLGVYPDPTQSDVRWILHKIVNNTSDRGGIILAYNSSTSEFYTGLLSIGSLNITTVNWIKHITQRDGDNYLERLTTHLNDIKNPHQSTKFHVGLSEVENLPVVTREDILCRKPVRKYVTHDALMLFWKIYLGHIKTLGDKEDENDEITVADRFRLIFAPCGPCGTQPLPEPPKQPERPPQIEPRDRLLATWCTKYDKHGRFTDGFGGSYEKLIEEKSTDCRYKRDGNFKERGSLLSVYCEGTTLYGKYADGRGSFYIGVVAEDSTDCSGVSTSDYTLIEIRDSEDTLYGYGYITTKLSPDPDATVMLTDAEGSGICYIFPQPKQLTKTGHEATVELRDANDALIGYVIKI